jgi:hypothetical protein
MIDPRVGKCVGESLDTHRSELRELNELNYARIDGRMNAMDARFDGMDARFDAMDARFGEFRHQVRADLSEHRRETEASIAEVKLAVAAVDAKIDRRYADLLKWSFVFWCGTFAAVALTWVRSMRLLTH